MAESPAAGAAPAPHAPDVALTDAQRQSLRHYVDLLLRWNATHNLTALRDPDTAWTHHVLDSLAALPAVDARLSGLAHPRVADIGSGAGLPGIPWAVARPAWEIHCIDAVAKKVAFLRQAAAQLRLPNVHPHHARVESAGLVGFDLVTSRAFASLADFVRLTRLLLAPEGVWLALKGRRPQQEIDALPTDVQVFHVEPIQVPGLAAERTLVWIRPAPPAA